MIKKNYSEVEQIQKFFDAKISKIDENCFKMKTWYLYIFYIIEKQRISILQVNFRHRTREKLLKKFKNGL